jgi:hypothetical protein
VIFLGLHALSVAGLLTAMQGSISVGAVAQGTAHSSIETSRIEYDLSGSPSVQLALREGRLDFSLGYTPFFTLRAIGDPVDQATLLMHNGSGSVGYRGPGYHLLLSEGVAYGTQSFLTLRTTPLDPNAPKDPTAANIELIPTAQTLRTFSEATTFTGVYEWSRRWRSSALATYAITGGLGAAAEQFVPQQRMASVGLSNDYLVTHDDHFSMGATVADVHVSNGYTHLTGAIELGWAHQFTPRLAGQLFGGGFAARTTSRDFTPYYLLTLTTGGSGTAQLIRRGKMALAANAGVAVAPQVNYLTGLLQQRVQGTAGLTLRIDRFSAGVNGDVAQTFPVSDPQAVRIVGAGANASYSVTRWLDLTASYRSAWQESHDPRIVSLPRQWSAVLGVAVRPPPIKL